MLFSLLPCPALGSSFQLIILYGSHRVPYLFKDRTEEERHKKAGTITDVTLSQARD